MVLLRTAPAGPSPLGEGGEEAGGVVGEERPLRLLRQLRLNLPLRRLRRLR